MSEYFAIEVDTSAIDEFVDDLGQVPESLGRHLHNAMDGTLDLLIDWTSAETPVNYGLLRGSWTKEISGEAVNLTGEMFTPLIYGWPVEQGRRPDKPSFLRAHILMASTGGILPGRRPCSTGHP